jgi:hypothetical protein
VSPKTNKPALTVIILAALLSAPSFGGDSAILTPRSLRVTLAPAIFAFQVQDWGGWGQGRNVMLYNAGLGVEWGVSEWLNAGVNWIPGFTAWSQSDGGALEAFSDFSFGMKAGIISPNGKNALLRARNTRLSVGLNMQGPVVSGEENRLAADMRLWGAEARVWYDYIFHRIFTLNMMLGVSYFPDQATGNTAFPVIGNGPKAKQPIGITFEAEGLFTYRIPRQPVTLRWGLPLTLAAYPISNLSGGFPYSFTISPSMTVSFTQLLMPVDITVKYDAAVAGNATLPLHRVNVGGRVLFDFNKLLKPKAAKAPPPRAAKPRQPGSKQAQAGGGKK